jgi:hypothetical protein
VKLIPNPGYRLFYAAIDINEPVDKVKIEELPVLGLARKDTEEIEHIWDDPKGTPSTELGFVYADGDGVQWVHLKNEYGFVVTSPTEDVLRKIAAFINSEIKALESDLRAIPEQEKPL